MNIKTFKLTSGEEFIAELIEDTETVYLIEKPVVVVAISEDKHAFSPWVVTSVETSYSIPKKDVRFAVDPVPDLLKAYEDQFGVGVIKPTAKQIITG